MSGNWTCLNYVKNCRENETDRDILGQGHFKYKPSLRIQEMKFQKTLTVNHSYAPNAVDRYKVSGVFLIIICDQTVSCAELNTSEDSKICVVQTNSGC